ncbi:adenosylcobinamide-phosphate synthase CbiB [Rhizobacter sp. OV335]|jgi:adenosylcobinamide-phosphate synthase|uniref:adenosylcobinamide-phosphate synthase CbiB n=1 Tax=Rhizobacter sp. OV335 TaxID=1500264 RepID=UPI000922BAB2|nr:adenosylcobinamide-phosphate synthase CbiB [Rhizobacter sp. OV335]SHN26814.1 adenosylcobinamide-phosphate synthase [Rhizobacter sp. OV335]
MFGAALLLAWAWDACFGEPRNALHPVAWLGWVLATIGRWLRRCTPRRAFIGGALAWLLIAAGLAVAATWLERELAAWPWWAAVPALALLLKPTFAWRMLRDEVAAIEAALGGGLEAARRRLARVVSRDTSALGADGIRETAIETLAENLSDSLVAPLFWYAVAGLPGAVVYRFANTADAMWGYRGEWEWAGKWAARADDVLSWLPARITAVLLHPSLRMAQWRMLRDESRLTPSPNGGWPMGAMALRLGVRLGKPGVYTLNAQARAPQSADVAVALRCAAVGAWTAVGVAALARSF